MVLKTGVLVLLPMVMIALVLETFVRRRTVLEMFRSMSSCGVIEMFARFIRREQLSYFVLMIGSA